MRRTQAFLHPKLMERTKFDLMAEEVLPPLKKARLEQEQRQCCAKCEYWEHTYRESMLVDNSVGTCCVEIKFDGLPDAFLKGWNGWTAMSANEGERCAAFKAKKGKSHEAK